MARVGSFLARGSEEWNAGLYPQSHLAGPRLLILKAQHMYLLAADA